MTGNEWATIIPLIFTGLVLLLNTYMGWQTRKTAEKTELKVSTLQVETEKATTDQNKQLAVIHDNGNAHLALMTEKLAASEERNVQLMADASTRIDARIQALEAMLQAQRDQSPDSDPVPVALPKEKTE